MERSISDASALGDDLDFLDREVLMGVAEAASVANLASFAFLGFVVPVGCLDACISSDIGLVKVMRPGVGAGFSDLSASDCCALAAFLAADAFLPDRPEATLVAALAASLSFLACVEGEATEDDVLAWEELRELGLE